MNWVAISLDSTYPAGFLVSWDHQIINQFQFDMEIMVKTAAFQPSTSQFKWFNGILWWFNGI